MLKYYSCLYLLIIAISCTNDKISDEDLTLYFSKGYPTVFSIDNFEKYRNSFQENDFYKDIGSTKLEAFIDFLKLSEIISYGGKTAMAFDNDSDDIPSISLLIRTDRGILSLDSLHNFSSQSEIRKNDTINVYTLNERTLYHKQKDGLHLFTNKKKNCISFNFEQPKKRDVHKLLQEANVNTVRYKKADSGFPLPLNFNLYNKRDSITISENLTLNFYNEKSSIVLNGVAKYDSMAPQTLINTVIGTLAQENLFSRVCPEDVDGAISLTFNNMNTFYGNLVKGGFAEQDLIDNLKPSIANELCMLKKGEESALIVYGLDSESEVGVYDQSSLFETYKNAEIHVSDKEPRTSSYMGSFFSENYRYTTRLDDSWVCSNELGFLHHIISSYRNETTLYNNDGFQLLMDNLSDESSIFIYQNNIEFAKTTNRQNNKKLSSSLGDNFAYGMQFIAEKKFAHVNAVLGNLETTGKKVGIQEDLRYNFESTLLGEPYFFENHLNNGLDILVQDTNNVVYLIDNSGKLLFKRQLDGPILGKASQLDTFKNGRKQLAFTTENRIYVISRAGKDVGNFPITFKDVITQPLSIFDYDNKRNYRLMVTQGSELLMLDKNGKRIKGFNYNGPNEMIITQPKHFRFNGKDYIVFAQGQRLKVLSRTGSVRIRIPDKFSFSENEIWPYDDKFCFVSQSGELIQVNNKGSISRNKLNNSINPKITSTTKTLVILDENNLKIRSNSIDLEFGQYTEPKIFFINNKIYVTVTDLQSNKTYLYDSQSKIIPGFPVYGNSVMDLGNFDGDNALEAVIKEGEKGIIVFQLN